MKSPIPQYNFYRNKYGSELLVDVVELEYVKRFLASRPVHKLSYYDITFITQGEGAFSIDNQHHEASRQDVFFSKPGEIRNWDTQHIANGYALIFEDEFLSSFFKDPMFVQHLSFFHQEKTSAKLHLSDELYTRILGLLHDIKSEIEQYKQNDVHVLRALLYEILMLLNRTYQNMVHTSTESTGNMHISKFMKLVEMHIKEQHSVQFYADQLCITPNYLNERVNSTLGMSAKQYICNKIIEEAKRMLIYTDNSISDIAFKLHYSTTSYFVRYFRQQTGETPLSYRKEYKP